MTITTINNFIAVSGSGDTRSFQLSDKVLLQSGGAKLRYSREEFGDFDGFGHIESAEAVVAGRALIDRLGRGKVQLFLTEDTVRVQLFGTETWVEVMDEVLSIIGSAFFPVDETVFVHVSSELA